MNDDRSHLGRVPALALVAGSILGIGIFIGPPVVASHLTSPTGFVLIWLAGGAAALFGALSVAELGAMLPQAGGDYPYIRLAYGPGVAFAVGWLQILAIFPGSLATISVATASFQLPVLLGDFYAWPIEALGLGIEASTFWAVTILLTLSALNHLGLSLSGHLQVILTTIPVVFLGGAGLYALSTTGLGEMAAFEAPISESSITVGAIALAYLPVYFAYSGWNQAIYVGGEIRDPKRNLPFSLAGGTLSVTLLYFLLCLGFMALLNMQEIADAGEVGTVAAGILLGDAGRLAITLLIMLAMLGSINGTVMAGARIPYAMAKQGHFPRFAERLSPRTGTPAIAIWIQTAISLALLATQRFEQLLNYATSAMLLSGTLTVLAVMVLRRRLPDQERPYRVWAYPLPPLFYAISSVVVMIVLISQRDPSTALAVGWFAGSLIVYRTLVAPRADAAEHAE